MRNGILVGFLAVLIGLPSFVAAAEPDKVGPLGDPACVVFEGNDTFSATEIRTAVAKDVRLLLASHPDAPLTWYLRLLKEQLIAGYRTGGFPDAKVSASVDPEEESVRVVISEGTRYKCGKIIFEGAEGLDVEAIREYLSSPIRPEKELRQEEAIVDGRREMVWKNRYGRIIPAAGPVWDEGRPAKFRKDYREYYRGWLVNACADIEGRYFPLFAIRWVRRNREKVVDLEVRVAHSGHVFTAGQIEFTGNERNSADDILNYAGLSPDTPMTTERWAVFDECVRRSGRFEKAERRPTTPSGGQERHLRTQVSLHERPGVPPLSGEFTPEERVMFKFCRWLRRPSLWQGDAVIDSGYSEEGKPDREIRMIWNPHSGVAFLQREAHVSKEEPAGDDAADHRWDGGLAFLSDRTLVWGPGSAEYYGCGRVPFTLGWLLTFALTDDNADGLEFFSVHFNPDYDLDFECLGETAAPHRGTPMPLAVEIDDPAGLSLLQRADEVRLENGVLDIVGDSWDMRIDAEFGRLISATMRDPALETPASDRAAEGTTLHFEADCLANTVGEIQERNRQSSNLHDPNSPLGSFIRFVGSSFIKNERDRELLLHPIENPPLTELRHHIVAFFGGQPETPAFSIPRVNEKMVTKSDEYRLLAARFWANGAARDEWPWQAGHLGFATCLHESPHAVSCAAFLENPDFGPLAYAAAYAICSESANEVACRCAELGMQRLTEEAFLRDLEPFCNKGTPLGKLAAQIVRLLQGLEPEELDRLASYYQEPRGSDVLAFIEYVRAHRKTDPAEFIRGAGRAAWHAGFRDVVRQWLM